MTDIILEQLEKVVAHDSDELHDKQTAIETYKLIKKKLTPMKAIQLPGNVFHANCPICEQWVGYESRYCRNCGQAIRRASNGD